MLLYRTILTNRKFLQMYTGNNQIAIRSQEWIREALFILLTKDHLKKISITDICNKAGISRQTFYNLFDNKEEIIINYFSNKFFIPSIHNDCNTNMCRHLLATFYTHVKSERKYLQIIFSNNLEYLFVNRLNELFIFVHHYYMQKENTGIDNILSNFFHMD